MPATGSPVTMFSIPELRAQRGAKWHRYPADILPAWVADMDFAVAPPIQRALERIVEQRDYGYALREGPDTVAAAFCDRMRQRFHWSPDADLVVEVSDLVQGMFACVLAYSAPGDGVVLQTPIYPPFLHAVDETGRRRVENPLRDTGERYDLDVESLRQSIDESTRILLVCNPHNPSGRVFTRGELEALGNLAVERDLVIVCDEIHADLLHTRRSHVPMATLGGRIAERVVTLTSATKSFNIPALRCGVLHFGSQGLLDRFTEAVPRRLLGHPGHTGVDATVAAWREGQPWLDQVLEVLHRNRDRVDRWVERQPGAAWYPPEATYLAWLDLSALRLAPNPQRWLLEEARVGVNPGDDFGTPGAGFVRLNFGTSPEILERVLERLSEALSMRLG
ncbi:MAG: PatB family C-S lyase [Candidatus Dormibacteraeota bacterium]|nr:PatB family C-S lyase [Candidatus Dormibacteraeota bacterium]